MTTPSVTELRLEVEDFLVAEAALLDARRFDEWLACFTDDATYEAPLRVTRESQVDTELSERGRIFWDSRATLGVRVERLRSEYAWAEQPPSRTRHFLTNLRVATGDDGAVEATVNLLVYRNRGEDPTYELYSAERRDELVRDASGSLRIRRRLVLVDQANLAGNSLSVFL